MNMRVTVLCLTMGLAAAVAHAAPCLYDLGTDKSKVWPGFTPVTAESIYSDQAGFGWQTKEGLRAYVRALEKFVENKSRGTDEPPPIWTNALTEDTIVGERESAFLFKASPGEYDLYVLCGSSEAFTNQYFDFTVSVGGQTQRVQVERGYQFRSLRFRVSHTQGPLAVKFTPRSKWFVNAIMAWTAADAERVNKEIIAPLEEWTYRLPPEEWAKWKQEAEPPTGPMPPLSVADQARGFVVWSRHYLECVYPSTKPWPDEILSGVPNLLGDKQPEQVRASSGLSELRLFASPGEYEPTNFVVLPLKDLTGAKVTVSDIGPVPSRSVDVRRVRYMRARPNYRVLYRYRVVPDILERFQALDLKAGENARFWLTLHVPDDAPPGNYSGKATFECSGGKAEVPIRLRILPIRLKEDPARIFGIYYRHPYDKMAGATDEVSKEYFRRKAELEHQDMVAHGTRNVTLHASSPPADEQGHFKFNWDLLAAKLDLWKRHGFVGPIVMGISTGGVYAKYMKESYGSHLRGVKDPPEEFCREMTAMVKAIETERKARGWPEFLYYPIDEPSTDPASVNFMVKVLKACKAGGVRTYVTADPTHDQFAPMRPFIDVWCTQPFEPDRETILADVKARGVEYWCYPNHVNGENDHTPVAGARMTYGFGFWRSGFRTLIPWIYSASSGDPFNYLDGSAMDFFNRWEPDGAPTPVALWEAYREGYDDYRYVYTLEQLIAEAKKGGAAAQKAAEDAEKQLKFVWDSIRVQAKYKYDNLWSPLEFDAYRWIVARQILAVQDALGRK